MKISKLQILLIIIVILTTVVSVIGAFYERPLLGYVSYIAIIAVFIYTLSRRKK